MIEQVAFQKKLQEIFVEAQMKNSAYSLRAYARRLGMAPSALSEILNGKRRVSQKLVERTVKKLALSPDESIRLLSLFPKSDKKAKSSEGGDYGKSSRDHASFAPQKLELSMDQFHIISEWYHFAILSLMETKEFRYDEKWIAKKLRLKIPEVKNAITRLLRVQLLKQDPQSGELSLTGFHYQTSDDIADIALRKAHATNLDLAKSSLERDEVSERDFTSSTLAIDIKKLPEAKKMIREFRKRLGQFLEADEKNEVYKITINLFPLSDLHPIESESISPEEEIDNVLKNSVFKSDQEEDGGVINDDHKQLKFQGGEYHEHH